MNDIKVTIYCLAYNHEKYIRNTLEGFVNQKTDFEYCVLVHDDASTDGTKAVINEYYQKYPDIIVPIYEKDNQYSKGVEIYSRIISPLIHSKYIAVCEGDDYWTDDKKLQMQFDYMEKHCECSLCVHNTKMINEDGSSRDIYFNQCKENRDYSAKDIIEATGGGLFHTSSFFYRYADRAKMTDAFQIDGIGDYSLAIFLSTLGHVHYFPEVMSCYRVGAVNSWVQREMGNRNRAIMFNKIVIKALKKMDIETKHIYEKSFSAAILKYEYRVCKLEFNLKKINKNNKLKELFEKESQAYKFKFYIKCILNKLRRSVYFWHEKNE